MFELTFMAVVFFVTLVIQVIVERKLVWRMPAASAIATLIAGAMWLMLPPPPTQCTDFRANGTDCPRKTSFQRHQYYFVSVQNGDRWEYWCECVKETRE